MPKLRIYVLIIMFSPYLPLELGLGVRYALSSGPVLDTVSGKVNWSNK